MKGLKGIISTVSLFLSLVSIVHSQSVFDIRKYGGGAGKDSTQALLSAWKAACAAGGTINIPMGTFPVGQATLQGPCGGKIVLNVQGTLKAPADPKALKGGAWIVLDNVSGVTITGGGIFDGQGQTAWNLCKSKCDSGLNSNLMFNVVTNSIVHGVTSLNSKSFHVVVLSSNGIVFQNFKVTAPGESPNTDGIHIGQSQNIHVLGSTIGTGDDCVSIGDGCSGIIISGLKCGPGHGISIGSLGRYPNEKPVSGITVKGCTLTNTDNGVRVKSWPGMYAGSASNIHFQDITMSNVNNPIIIDQTYCPGHVCPSTTAASRVKISGVAFSGIKGTSKIANAVTLKCTAGQCQNVQLSNIALTYNGGSTKAVCHNVKPTISGSAPAGC